MTLFTRRSFVRAAVLSLALAASQAPAGYQYLESARYLGSGNGVDFSVYAPHAESISVVGEFNGWNGAVDPMTKGPGDIWTAHVGNAGAYQQYKFLVNGSSYMNDPMSLRVLGIGGSNSMVEDLDAYPWSSDDANFQIPSLEKLVIYEVHITSFMGKNDGIGNTVGQRFNEFLDKLDYLEETGINAIELMPVHEFPGNDSWGYNPVFFSAIESSYGTPYEFQRLVDECHKRGIAVILDVVYNHVPYNDVDHLMNFDGGWVNGTGGNGSWFWTDSRGPTPWGPEVRWDSARVRSVLVDNALLWVEKYHVDGLRVDSSQTIRKEDSSGEDWNGVDGSDPDGEQFLRELNDALRPYKNGRFITTAEDLADNPLLTRSTTDNGGLGFLTQWSETHAIEGELGKGNDSDRDMDAIASAIRIDGGYNDGKYELMRFHTSHDTAASSRFPDRIGDPTDSAIKKRSLLANLATVTGAGTPMLFMGDEFYQTGYWSDSSDMSGYVDWNNLGAHSGYYKCTRDLIRLKTGSAAMHTNNVTIDYQGDTNKILVWRRWGAGGEVVQFVANFTASDKTVSIPFPEENGTFNHIINSDWAYYGGSDDSNLGSTTASNYWASVTIPAYGFIAFSQTECLQPEAVIAGFSPSDGATDIPPNPLFTWTAALHATSYKLYLGTSFSAVADATEASEEYKGQTDYTTFGLYGLSAFTIYYWRVDAVNASGTAKGQVNSFTTNGTAFPHTVDGWSGDWVAPNPGSIHEFSVQDNEGVYLGSAGDWRTFSGSTIDADITEVRFTADSTYLHVLVRMADITDADLPAVAMAIDTDQNTNDAGHMWIGDGSAPSGAMLLGSASNYAEREVMLYCVNGQPRIKLWDGGVWYDPPSGNWQLSISPAFDTIEARIARSDLGIATDDTVGVSLVSFRASGQEAGSDATYDSPDNNNDAIDFMGGQVGVDQSAWDRDLSDDTISYTYRFVLNGSTVRPALAFAGWVADTSSGGFLNPGQNLTIGAETWPLGAASGGTLHYRQNGGGWFTASLGYAGQTSVHGPNELWQINMGSFATGMVFAYYIELYDPSGTAITLNNGGANYAVKDPTPPAAPIGVTAVEADSTIVVDWSNSPETDVVSYKLYRSTTSGSGYGVIVGNLTQSNYVDSTGSIGTTYYYKVTAIDRAGNESAQSVSASATLLEPSALPSGWSTGDIGATGVTGSSAEQGGNYTITGAGADIEGTSDGFQFAYRQMTGDCQITARVANVPDTDPWAKAGVMIRSSLAANAQNAMALISSSNGAAFQRRTVSGGGTSSTVVSGITAPRWVRVVRSGSTFTGYYSSNGSAWTAIGSATIPMGSTVYLGLAVTSHVSGTLGTGTLDGVTVSPVDNTSPTVNLTTATSPVSGPFDITVAFSEAITGLSLTDFTVTNGSATALDGADSTYTLTVAPTTSGTVSTAMPAGATMDAASNSNFGSNILDVLYTP